MFEGRLVANNLGLALDPTELRLPVIGLAGLGDLVFAGTGVPSWFRVDPSLTGLVELSLDAVSAGGRTVLYAAAGRMPTPQDFEARSAEWDSPDARLTVEAGAGGAPIYVLVVPETMGGAETGFRFSAGRVEFALTRVGFSRAANSGTATVPIEGRGFRSDLRLSLVGPDGLERHAEEVLVKDASGAYARFDLRGAALGLYRMEGTSGGVRSVLPDAIEVVGPKENRLEVRLVLPETARERRPFDLYLEYRNTGGTDMAIPRLSLECLGGSGEIWWPGQDESRFRETALSFVRLAGPEPAPLEDGDTDTAIEDGTGTPEGEVAANPALQGLGVGVGEVGAEPLVLLPGPRGGCISDPRRPAGRPRSASRRGFRE